MCGIFGIFGINNGLEVSEEKFLKGLETMNHRGPDATGFQKFDSKGILGHLRLSIIDLDESSNQPMVVDNRYWIVFNGEIFNYIELREELSSNYGCTFETDSDTEVLLRSYIVWGIDCLSRFNGMWSFVIYDSYNNSLFCSRDRFGIKPFNYAIVDNTFVFSSEIKAIIHYYPELRVPNYNIIANYCRTSVGAQHEVTWFKDIKRLMPGHYMTIDSGQVAIERYWDFPAEQDVKLDEEEIVKGFREIFFDSVNIRMRSDVLIGTTLSSGIDSSSIVSTLREFNNDEHLTYTANFDQSMFTNQDSEIYSVSDLQIDEPSIVKVLASDKKLNSKLVNIDYNDLIEELSQIIFHLESGNSSPAVFPLMKIMEDASREVTVVLEGQGADELMGGYANSLAVHVFLSKLSKFQFKDAIVGLRTSLSTYNFSGIVQLYLRYLSNAYPLISKIQQKISGVDKLYIGKIKRFNHMADYPFSYRSEKSSLNRLLKHQFTGGLVNLLHYGDAISMANSLESRLPFLDYRLVEYVFRLPDKYKYNQGVGKYILREAMRNIVPDYILDNKIKFGFTTPISMVFSSNESSAVKLLLSSRSVDRGIFDKNELEKIIAKHISGKKNYSTLLYRLLCVELWFRKFIDEN